ncbi:MAG: DUF4124 domain-containing protein [Gammaproteobacteria bacterium]|nr:DUF4124 domain-containing protein [Gammaproteobacteria bacterium]
MKPISTLTLIAALLAFALAALSFDATAQRKLYRWTDKDGNVHYTDQLPPEAAQDKREELNRQGITVRTTERARTPEEQAEWEAEQKRLEAERIAAEEVAKMDAVLIGSYPTEADLQRAYNERFDLLEQSLESARVGIRSQEKSLAELLAHAADLERDGQKVPPAITDSIARTRDQVNDQRAYLERRETERAALQTEYDQLLARYRELKSDADDSATA